MDDTQPTAAPPPATDYLALAREAFSSSTSYFDANIRKQVESALRQFQGVHPAGSKYHAEAYKGRARFFRPKTRASVRKSEASAAEAFFTTNSVVACEAEDDGDPKKKLGAQLMQHLLNYRLKKSIPWFLTCIGAYQDAMTVGVCIGHAYWHYEPKKKIDKPCLDLIPVENLRLDPGANWTDPVNTSPYVIRMIPMYVKDVKAKMREPDHKTGLPAWRACSESQLLAAVTSYGDPTRLTRERGRTDSKEQNSNVREFAIVWVHQNIVEIDGVDMLYYTLGTEFMLTDARPLKEAYLHGIRPFVVGYCALETHKNYPDGPVGLTRDVQGEINEIANQRIDNVKFAMNKRYFGKRGTQIDLRSLTRNVVGSVTMMNDPEKDVKVIDTPDVTRSAYEEQDRLNVDFDDVAGAFSPSSIQSNRSLNETVGGLQLLSANTNQVGSYQLRTFVETFVEPVLSQLAQLEAYYETDDTILAMAGRKAGMTAEMIQSGELDSIIMNPVTLNISVGIGSTSPQEQINNLLAGIRALKEVLADGVLERYGLNVSEVIEEVFGKLGHKDGSRFFDMANQDPALRSALTQIDQLRQQLDQKMSPEMMAAQVRKLDATTMETTMRMFFASGQAAQMLAAVPALAPLMDFLAMAAGYKPMGGVDPSLPQLSGPATGLTQNSVKDPRTGIEFTPGGDTSPQTPANPATPATGAEAGINTMRAGA